MKRYLSLALVHGGTTHNTHRRCRESDYMGFGGLKKNFQWGLRLTDFRRLYFCLLRNISDLN